MSISITLKNLCFWKQKVATTRLHYISILHIKSTVLTGEYLFIVTKRQKKGKNNAKAIVTKDYSGRRSKQLGTFSTGGRTVPKNTLYKLLSYRGGSGS